MRFMIIVKATRDSEAGVMPDEALLSAMQKYHEELVKSGVLVDASGLKPSSKGWRIRYSGDKRTFVDGPFAETKEALLGFYLVDCESLEEAIDYAKQLANEGGAMEVRPVMFSNVGPGKTGSESR